MTSRSASLPSWMTEVALPHNRPALWLGMWSGYGVAFGFGGLALAAGSTGIVPHRWGFYTLIALKLVTNTIALMGLRRDRYVLETQTVNTLVDVVTMTGAIYLTGGPLSPLFGVYLILIAVLAALTNVGITILATGLCWTAHAIATLLVYFGVLEAIPPPGSTGMLETGGQVALALVFAAFLLGAAGAFTGLLVQRLREKTQSLEARTHDLIRANHQRTMLLANLTHELRTPIHGITGLVNVLEAGIYGPVSDAQKEAFASVHGAATQLLGMIDDLLTLSRAEAGAMKLKLVEVGVEGLMETVLGSVQWMVGTKNLTLELEMEDGLPDTIVTDRGKLSQILVNLLVNAVKFTPEGGTITVLVGPRDPRGVEFSVTDTGVGIPRDRIDHIWEPFEQLDSSDEREYGGTGLGLAIVKRLSRMIQGRISVQSEPGLGTTFELWIPNALDSDDSGEILLDVTGAYPDLAGPKERASA